MKPCYVLLIPRHVNFLLLIVCSCHMILLLSWASVNNQPHAPLVEQEEPENSQHHSESALQTKQQNQFYLEKENEENKGKNPLVFQKVLQKEQPPPRRLTAGFRAITAARRDLSSAGDREVPGGGINGYIGRQLNSNLLEAHKTNGGSSAAGVAREYNKVHHTSRVSNSATKTPEEGRTKEWKPLIYSKKALQQFYEGSDTTALHSNAKRNNSSGGIVFRYVIKPPVFICERSEDSRDGVYLMVMVHSHPANKPQRDAIRNTWGRLARNYDTLYQMRLVFVLGVVDGEISMGDNRGSRRSENQQQQQQAENSQQNLIWKESNLYRDILQGYFADSYENLSVKSLFAIDWASRYCLTAKYMLKTDDDSYINTSLLIQWLRDQSEARSSATAESAGKTTKINKPPTVIGAVNRDATVMRSGLWQVPFNVFPFNKYPTYCTGCAYVLSASILTDLLLKSRSVGLIPVEDAYITGILVTLIGHKCTNHRHFPQWYMGPSKANICKLVKQDLYGVHNVPYHIMYDIYRNITKNSFETCVHKKHSLVSSVRQHLNVS